MYVTDAANTVILSGFQSGNITVGTLGSLTWSMHLHRVRAVRHDHPQGPDGCPPRRSGRLRSPAHRRLLVEDIGLA